MSTVFHRGFVVDVITSTSGLTVLNKEIESYKSLVTSTSLKSIPRNTAIVKDISRGSSKLSGKEIVCYPFFSSHLSMPLKPGEAVWFIFEDPEDQGELAYWISRVSEPNHVEDVNFSFFSRTYRQDPNKKKKTASEKFDAPVEEGDVAQTDSFYSPTSDPTEMMSIVEYSKKIHRFEAVPRYNKRVGDLIIQGSNNSLIMLGEERGHYSNNPTDIKFSANRNDITPGHGAIDIVVGRGKGESTAGKKIKNELGVEEIDKRNENAVEGDAHFLSDASRIYLTANSFEPNAPYHPDELLNITLPSDKGLDFSIKNDIGSFAIVKSDNLRLVGRSAGSIRIIKESTPSVNDGAAILLHADGTVQISASNKVLISSYNTDGATEPYVRYTELVSFLTSIMQDLQSFCQTLSTHVTPGFGAPSPQITAAAATLLASVTTKQTQLQAATLGLGSTVIYGE